MCEGPRQGYRHAQGRLPQCRDRRRRRQPRILARPLIRRRIGGGSGARQIPGCPPARERHRVSSDAQVGCACSAPATGRTIFCTGRSSSRRRCGRRPTRCATTSGSVGVATTEAIPSAGGAGAGRDREAFAAFDVRCSLRDACGSGHQRSYASVDRLPPRADPLRQQSQRRLRCSLLKYAACGQVSDICASKRPG